MLSPRRTEKTARHPSIIGVVWSRSAVAQSAGSRMGEADRLGESVTIRQGRPACQ